MFGWAQEELIGRPLPLIPEEREDEFQAYWERVLQGESPPGLEMQRRRKDGSRIDVGIWAAPVRDDEGEMSSVMVVVEDLTARQLVEETRRELAVLEERNWLAREIHDTLAQGLIGIIWQLNAAERTLGDELTGAHEAIEKVREVARESLKETRRSVWDLRAGPLLGLTLVQAIGREADRTLEGTGMQNELRVSGEERAVPSGVEAAALRITQEALANVVKHADAERVEIEIGFGESELRLLVSDDGSGFAPEMLVASSDGGGFGLVNMRERARLLGGEAVVRSESGTGTTVEITIPLS